MGAFGGRFDRWVGNVIWSVGAGALGAAAQKYRDIAPGISQYGPLGRSVLNFTSQPTWNEALGIDTIVVLATVRDVGRGSGDF